VGKIRPLTSGDVDRWYERLRVDPLAWVIEADGKAVGHCRLHSLDHENRAARYAIGIFNREYWGRGLGTQTTRLVLAHAFTDMKLHRVDLRVLSYNARAIACFTKCGFVEEGRERDSVLVAGKWHTDVRMSILAREYRSGLPT
jgi:RimJ/RimL family protein N-acetyltransferase